MMPTQRNKNYMQLCWVVPELEKSIMDWVNKTGAGPFFVFESLQFDDARYRGQPANVQPCRAAIGQFGDMQIELVQPTTDGPGIWTDVVPKGGTGLHHTGLYCEDYEAERAAYAATEADVVFEGKMMGARTCYIDTMSTLGFMTELITANPIAASVFATFKEAALGWDGKDPIRTMG